MEAVSNRLEVALPVSKSLTPGKALLLPSVFIIVLITLGLLMGLLMREPLLARAMLGAAGALVLLAAVLYVTARRSGRTLSLDIVLRPNHYVQAGVLVVLFSYWGYHVPAIRPYGLLVLAQLMFAYGFHILLTWSRRDNYELGFGPFPITCSINVFLLFKPEWFHWQFVMVALGFAAKEFIRWRKEGRSSHIFNPSSFTLAVFSVVLILTGSTDHTLGVEIAQILFNPPHIYAVLFLVSIPGQLIFGVATMTITAVLTAYAFGLFFFAATGTYYFLDAYIPIAVFLGMHLLFTDPPTAPRSEPGRILFGVVYGLAVIGMYALLSAFDLPGFYDKLLPVPIMNLFVRFIDRGAASGRLRFLDLTGFGERLTSMQRRTAAVGLWAVTFVAISGAGGVGDKHPGQYLPFWQEACEAGSDRACDYLPVMLGNFCGRDSGWACNELGIHRLQREGDRSGAMDVIDHGCELGFPTACENGYTLRTGSSTLLSAAPLVADLPIVLRGSKGAISERDPQALYALACERGWPDTCGGQPVEP